MDALLASPLLNGCSEFSLNSPGTFLLV